ncbi:DoxX family membrane protein [Xylophilus rhododendri]|uniref:DoxX family membrane protein n=1 Tax=Xylophilus rhododendri TaxID=2697032 RepID=A0A857J2P9_9BURK|nr:DoxX family protein [Xylophilus rhododendri]QHI97513.1 DoxX family membrane protein [Xylophilus rhododendri]
MPHDTALLIARICLVLMFPFSCLDKIVNRRDALAQAASNPWVPAAFAPLLLVLGGLLEIAGPVCVVSGWMARPAAALLALYCVATALLFHRFWASGDFWQPGASAGRAHFWDFTKNLGLTGGLLLVALGQGF